MTVDQLVQHYGTMSRAAQAVGLKHPALCAWRKKGEIPEPRQYQYEVLTGGSLKADRDNGR